jgi:hypothetical protein
MREIKGYEHPRGTGCGLGYGRIPHFMFLSIHRLDNSGDSGYGCGYGGIWGDGWGIGCGSGWGDIDGNGVGDGSKLNFGLGFGQGLGCVLDDFSARGYNESFGWTSYPHYLVIREICVNPGYTLWIKSREAWARFFVPRIQPPARFIHALRNSFLAYVGRVPPHPRINKP